MAMTRIDKAAIFVAASGTGPGAPVRTAIAAFGTDLFFKHLPGDL